jgi:hypothetical protein
MLSSGSTTMLRFRQRSAANLRITEAMNISPGLRGFYGRHSMHCEFFAHGQ